MAAGRGDIGAARTTPLAPGMRATAMHAATAHTIAPSSPHPSRPRLSPTAPSDATTTASPHPSARATRPVHRAVKDAMPSASSAIIHARGSAPPSTQIASAPT